MPLRLSPLLLAAALALTFAACGESGEEGAADQEGKSEQTADENPFQGEPVDLPDGAAAVIGEHVISDKQFDAWLQLLGKEQMRANGIPDEFIECETWISNLFRSPEEQQRPFRDELTNAACEKRFEEEVKQPLAPSTLELLIRADWVDREAKAQGATASTAEVLPIWRKKLEENFTEPRYAREYEEGLSPWERRQRFVDPRLQVLLKKLLAKRRESQPPVSEQQIRREYRKDRDKYRTPETRMLEYVGLGTKAEAEKAKRSLENGEEFAAVAREFGGDEALCCETAVSDSLSSGSGTDEKTLAGAALAAPRGQLTGPVKIPAGWYVFKVTRVVPEGTEPLAEHRKAILRRLRAKREDELQPRFIEDMHERYRGITKCDEDLALPMCSNGPEPRREPKPKE